MPLPLSPLDLLPIQGATAQEEPVPEEPPAPAPPTPVERPTYQTVQLAQHFVHIELSEPPPPAGMKMQLHSLCFPEDPDLANKLVAKATATTEERRRVAAQRHPWTNALSRHHQEAAEHAARQQARVQEVVITPDDFLENRGGTLIYAVMVQFDKAAPEHPVHVVPTVARLATIPRADGAIAFVWNDAQQPNNGYRQWRRSGTGAAGSWTQVNDLAEARAYQPGSGGGKKKKAAPPSLLTLRAKSGCRTELPTGDSLSVRVTTGAVSLPPADSEWWVRPAAWEEDASGWTELQQRFVRDGVAYAAGDRVIVRVYRTPKGDGAKPDDELDGVANLFLSDEELAELSAEEKAEMFPAFPPANASPLQELVYLASDGFARVPGQGTKPAHHTVSAAIPVRYPVRWEEGEAYSLPIEVELRYTGHASQLKVIKARVKKDEQEATKRAGSAEVLVSVETPLAARKKPGAPPPPPGPPQVGVIGELEVARRLAEDELGLTKDGAGWKADGKLELLHWSTAPAGAGSGTANDPLEPLKAILLVGAAGEQALRSLQPAPGGGGQAKAATRPVLFLGDDEAQVKRHAASTALRVACLKPQDDPPPPGGQGGGPSGGQGGGQPSGPPVLSEWTLLARELLVVSGLKADYRAAPGTSSRGVQVDEFRRVYFDRGDVDREHRSKHLIADELELHVQCNPPPLRMFHAMVHSVLFGRDDKGLFKDYRAVFEPGESRVAVKVKLEATALNTDSRLFLALPWGPPELVLGYPEMSTQKLATLKSAKNRKVVQKIKYIHEVDGLVVKVKVPKLRFHSQKPVLQDKEKRSLLEKFCGLFGEDKVKSVVGQGETVELQLELSEPARAGTKVWIVSEAFGAGLANMTYEVELPEGQTAATYEVTVGGGVGGSPVPLDIPLPVTVIPAGTSNLCQVDPDSKAHIIHLVVAALPVVNLAYLEQDPGWDAEDDEYSGIAELFTEDEEGYQPSSPPKYVGVYEGIDELFRDLDDPPPPPPPPEREEDETDYDGVAELFDEEADEYGIAAMFEEAEQEALELDVENENPGALPLRATRAKGNDAPKGGDAKETWISPLDPFAVGDTAKVRVLATAPVSGDAPARLQLVSNAFDSPYPVELQPGELQTVVEVAFRKEAKRQWAEIRLEPVSGCLVGHRAIRRVRLYPQRQAYLPPRMCIAPGNQAFVEGDCATVTARILPPAPVGGAEVVIEGPCESTTIAFEQGEYLKSASIKLNREADTPQPLVLKPKKACSPSDGHTTFDVMVKTPEVQLAAEPIQGTDALRINGDAFLLLELSHPAPGPKPYDDTFDDEDEYAGLDMLFEEDACEGDGTAVVVSCQAFVQPEVVVRALPGEEAVRVPVRVKPDAATDAPQEYTIKLSRPRRAALGARAEHTVQVYPAPSLRFAASWIEPAAPNAPDGSEPAPDEPGPPATTNAAGEVVFKVGQAAKVTLEVSEAPEEDLTCLLKSPAFGAKVYVIKLPKKVGKKDKETNERVTITQRVVFARGHKPESDGITPEKKMPLQLFPPPGWQVADERGLQHVNVVNPALAEPCPLDEMGLVALFKEEQELEDPAPFDEPCTLNHVMVAEFHGSLALGPSKPHWQQKAQEKEQRKLEQDRQQGRGDEKGMRKEASLRQKLLPLEASQLIVPERGPFHLVPDKQVALDAGAEEKDILLYTPGKLPVLEVIAGPAPDPLAEPADPDDPSVIYPNDPRYHSTHISLQVKRGVFCRNEFEERRRVPRNKAFATFRNQLLKVMGGVPELPAEVVARRHHPIVNLRQRGGCALATLGIGPLKHLRKHITHWKHVYPPFPDLRLHAATDEDPIKQQLTLIRKQEPQDGGDPSERGGGGQSPGEDETTHEGYATLCNFTVFPAAQVWDYMDVNPPHLFDDLQGVQGVLPPTLVASLPPEMRFSLLGTMYDWLLGAEAGAVGAINDTVGVVNEVGTDVQTTSDDVCGVVNALALERSSAIDPSAGWDPQNLRLGGVPISSLINMISFPFMKPREYEVEVQTCGVPDVDHPNSGGPCEALKMLLKVYPSAEFCIRYEFKGTPDTLKFGAEGSVYGGTPGEHTIKDKDGNPARGLSCATMVPNPAYDSNEPISDTNQEYVESGTHLTPIEVEQGAHEARVQRQTGGPTGVNQGPNEGVGEGEAGLTRTTPGDEVLQEARFHEVERGRTIEDPKAGWHGGAKPGAPQGWKPKQEPGQSYPRSRVFHPVGPPGDPFGEPIADEQTPQDLLRGLMQESLGIGRETPGMALEATMSGAASGGALEGLQDGAQVVLDSISRILETVKQLGEGATFSFGFGVRLELAFLEGRLVWYWGWKEHESRYVFPWFHLDMDLILMAIRFQVDVGFSLSAGFIRFELLIYLRLSLDASIKGGFQTDLDTIYELQLKRERGEAKGKDWLKAALPEWIDTWLTVRGQAEVGVKIVLIHEHVLSAGAAVKTGLELRYRIAPGLPSTEGHAGRLGIEHELYFLGVTATFTFTIMGKAKLKRVVRIMEGNPEGLPWKRGALPSGASRAFWNARKSLKVAWNKMLHHRRRIQAVLDKWEQLQLGMVASSTRTNQDGTPRYPYTSIPPGWGYTGKPDDEEERRSWEENKDAWDRQWEECKSAFAAEAMTRVEHRKKGAFKRVKLEDHLSKKVTRAEHLIHTKLLKRMKALAEAADKIRALEALVDAEEQLADDRGKVTKELIKDCAAMERDPNLNWSQNRWNQPLTELDHLVRSIEYYAAQRVSW